MEARKGGQITMRWAAVAEPGGFEVDNQLPRLGYRGR